MEDLRVKKTKIAIRKAFLELLKDESFEKITVNQIAKKAMVGKGTFYYHYADKYDLAKKTIQYYMADYRKYLHQRLQLGGEFNNETIHRLTDSINYIADEFLLLRQIRTSEIDVDQILKEEISSALLPTIKKSKIQSRPQIIADLMASLLLEVLTVHKCNDEPIDLTVMRLLFKDISIVFQDFS